MSHRKSSHQNQASLKIRNSPPRPNPPMNQPAAHPPIRTPPRFFYFTNPTTRETTDQTGRSAPEPVAPCHTRWRRSRVPSGCGSHPENRHIGPGPRAKHLSPNKQGGCIKRGDLATWRNRHGSSGLRKRSTRHSSLKHHCFRHLAANAAPLARSLIFHVFTGQ